ncbi:hypothetical protein [Chloroflexus sp.]|uniref:hypothetical protein n=1 Tax=Chloroflexus sp. TaxID=1904827 RepID=UPI002ADE6DFA|nr:hypothetical protein [Chloroflexus sp.]
MNGRWLRWLIWIAGALLLAGGLELVLGAGGSGIGVALSIIGGGLIQYWRERPALSCGIRGPRLHPLQVSAFGLMGLGVLWYQGQGGDAITTLSTFWPALGSSWIPLVLVVAGVGWLGLLSIQSSCRDEQLLAMMGEHDRR